MLLFRLAAVCVIFSAASFAQTTNGMITGKVRDQSTATPLENALVDCEQLNTHTRQAVYSASDGNYYLSALPPGSYRLRVSLTGYQAREIYDIALLVAGYVGVDFDLRRLSDVWEHGRYGSAVFRDNTVLPFYGPDVDPSYVGVFEPEHQMHGQLEPSISEVIDPIAVATLPLAGRDVYSALVLQPGVAADVATSRSLGLSVNGQRISSSNFLLDGIEENDQILSGPALQLAPEMVQEYRVSTNNFSAEYGRTSGYIANAISRSAGVRWHGIVYSDLNNSALNANAFQHNANGMPRAAQHQIETGISVGGAIPRTRVFTWTTLDYFGSRSFSDPQTYDVPTRAFADALDQTSRAWQLLHTYPPVQWANSFLNQARVTLSGPVTLRRFTGLERLDYAPSERNHFTLRLAGDTLERPDFYWNAYGQAPLKQSTVGIAAAAVRQLSASVMAELRAGMQTNHRNWDLGFPNLPSIIIGDVGTALLNKSDWRAWSDRTRSTELSGTVNMSKGAHVTKIGGGLLDIRLHTRFATLLPDFFEFQCLACSGYAFAFDDPLVFETTLSRTALADNQYAVPDSSRAYRYEQPYFFLQEDWRVTPRFTANAGLRYDRFTAPVNIGTVPDVIVQPGPGPTLDTRLNAASFASQRGQLYSNRPNNWAVRLGFSALLSQTRGTLMRGGFGFFDDRPPDNFWLTASVNDAVRTDFGPFTAASCDIQPFYKSGNYRNRPSECVLPPEGGVSALSTDSIFDPTLFQPRLRIPKVKSIFLALEQPLGRHAVLTFNGTFSQGRHLLATDVLNRLDENGNSALGSQQVTYRTDLGSSDYSALSTVLRYRSGRATFSTAWTWSRSIDNQSDPLLGEFFDLGFSNQTDRSDRQYYSGFTLEGNPRADHGNSDFDQRQNVVGWASLALPYPRAGPLTPALRNWSTATVFAVRSGLPYSVYADGMNCTPICNTRADLLDPGLAALHSPTKGGEQLLNPVAFAAPAPGHNGNSGRNEFRGPGFSNLDLSVARTFIVPRLGEQTKVVFRFDAFNLVNHANLQNPDTNLSDPLFGVAHFGSASPRTGFPALTPLIPSPRQIHILLRVEF